MCDPPIFVELMLKHQPDRLVSADGRTDACPTVFQTKTIFKWHHDHRHHQCDQTLELKVAQFSPMWPKKVAKAILHKRGVFKIAQKVTQYLG